jgi:hypothetical protein
VAVLGKCIASQGLRAEPGVPPTEPVAPYGLRKPTPRPIDRFGQHAVGLIHFEWRKVAPQVRLKALVSWLVAIGLIATRYLTHVYLRASWTKANLPRGRSAKPKGLSKEKVAGLPKGDY